MLNEVPGSELPKAVYRTVALSFVWMMSAAWLAFGGAAGTDVDLFVASLILAVLTVLPALVRKTAMRHLNETAAPSSRETSPSWVDTATGPVTSTQAWVQIATIPVALAAAATLLGLVYSVAGA